MAQLGILFDPIKLGGSVPGYTAFRILFSVVDPRMLAGSTLFHGDAGDGKLGNSEPYCIAVESFDSTVIAQLRAAIADCSARGLLPGPGRFLSDAEVSQLPLDILASLNDNGELVDCQEQWLTQAWARSRREGLRQAESAPRPVAAQRAPRPTGFPDRVPTVLRWPESVIRWLGGAGAVSFAVAVSAFTALARRIDPLTPGFASLSGIACLTMWGIGLCWARWLRVRKWEALCDRQLLVEAAHMTATGGPALLVRQAATPACLASPALQRAHAVSREWLVNPSLQNAMLALGQIATTESELRRAAYRIPRMLAILAAGAGVLGAVSGGALPANPFMYCLTAGFAAGALLWFLIAGLESRETSMSATLAQDISDVLLPALEKATPEKAPVRADSPGELLRETLQQVAGKLLEEVQVLRRESEEQAVMLRSSQQEQISEWTRGMRQESEGAAARLADSTRQVTAEYAAASGALQQQLARWADALSAHGRTLDAALEQQAKMARTLASALEEMEGLEEFGQTMSGIRYSLESLAPVLKRFQEPFVLQAVPAKPMAFAAAV